MTSTFTNIFLCLSALLISLSPSSLAEEKPQSQLNWEKKVGAKSLNNPAYAYVKDDPALPRVLLIGDSISIGYTPYVRTQLNGKVNVHRIPQNGSNTQTGLDKLDEWLRGEQWDVIHVNWGLHDLKYLKDGKLNFMGAQVHTPEQYRKNLNTLATRLKATKAQIIWCMTTPVPKGASGRVSDQAIEYNAIAREVMTQHAIPINDLHAYMTPTLATYQRPANVHFTPEGSEHLAKEVSRHITQALAKQTRAVQTRAAARPKTGTQARAGSDSREACTNSTDAVRTAFKNARNADTERKAPCPGRGKEGRRQVSGKAQTQIRAGVHQGLQTCRWPLPHVPRS